MNIAALEQSEGVSNAAGPGHAWPWSCRSRVVGAGGAAVGAEGSADRAQPRVRRFRPGGAVAVLGGAASSSSSRAGCGGSLVRLSWRQRVAAVSTREAILAGPLRAQLPAVTPS